MFSTSPVLIRWAAPLPATEIAFGRMLIAAVAVLLAALWLGQLKQVFRAALPRFALYGLFAAVHFGLYIASLQHTSVAHALALVYTAPIFVTFFSARFLAEKLPARAIPGLIIAVAGVTILTGFEPRLNVEILLGDAMALGSAVAFGAYSVAGRRERHRYSLLVYAGMVYACAALWLLPVTVPSFSLSVSTSNVIALVLLALLPLALGHTLYNAALRKLHASAVNVVATQEVTGGVLLSALLLGEIPSAPAVIGAAVTLAGVTLVVAFAGAGGQPAVVNAAYGQDLPN